MAGGGVGVALDGGVGGDDQDVAGVGGGAGGLCAGLDDAEDGDGDGVLNGVECQGAGGVAGDDEELGALLADQELGALGGVAGDGAAGLGAVREAGGVAEEGEAGLRHALDEGAQDGEAAEAGVEDADGWGHGCQNAGLVKWKKSARSLDSQHNSMKTLLEYGLRAPCFMRIALSWS